jgi:hypothetical protein
LAGVLAVGFVLLVGCSDDGPDSSRQDRPLVALLSDGELLSGTTARRLMAVTPDRRLLAVLLATPGSGRTEVVVLTEGPELAGGRESEITVVDPETGSVGDRLPHQGAGGRSPSGAMTSRTS